MFLFLGCLESLAYYKRLLLLRHLTASGGDEAVRMKVKKECLATLSSLERIDPFRVQRYQELGERYLAE